MLVAVVSKLALTPATRARRVRTPRTAHTPTTHTVVGRSPIIVGPENQPFLARQPNARDPGNKAAASAHGMGSGGLAVDAMAVGSLGVERRVERSFALHSFCSPVVSQAKMLTDNLYLCCAKSNAKLVAHNCHPVHDSFLLVKYNKHVSMQQVYKSTSHIIT